MGMMVNSFRYAAAGGPASYRYYFIEFLTTGNGFIGCSTVKCLDAGGTDHALQSNGGTASAVGYTVNGSFPVTNVNDGNDSSFTTSSAGTAAGSGKGIQIDLGATEAITKIGYRARSDGFGANEAIRTGNIYGKVNSGDAWTLIRAVDELGIASNEYREFPFTDESPTSTDWRVYVRATQTGGAAWTACRELELHDSVGGADITTGATMTASGSNGGNVPANTIDNNSATYWTSGAAAPVWLRANKGAAFIVKEFSWQIFTTVGDSPKDVDVQYLNSSGGWTTYWTKRTIIWSSSDQTQVVTKP